LLAEEFQLGVPRGIVSEEIEPAFADRHDLGVFRKLGYRVDAFYGTIRKAMRVYPCRGVHAVEALCDRDCFPTAGHIYPGTDHDSDARIDCPAHGFIEILFKVIEIEMYMGINKHRPLPSSAISQWTGNKGEMSSERTPRSRVRRNRLGLIFGRVLVNFCPRNARFDKLSALKVIRMSIRVHGTDLHIINMHTRMPFRYGIATLTAIPHLFVRVFATIDGVKSAGVAADGLSQKWFTKNPDAAYEDEIADMLTVIRSACRLATQIEQAPTVFGYWRSLYRAQAEWATGTSFPPLLWGFGVSFVERALIEAFCRAKRVSFYQALKANGFGIKLEEMHEELHGRLPGEFLPANPLRQIVVRHTVGLADPLTENDITEGATLNDGLPHSLEACIREYGIKQLKVKLSGDCEADVARIERIFSVVRASAPVNVHFTLDGNENYHAVETFQEFWRVLEERPALRGFLQNMLFVEQPLHRDVSLGDTVKAAFADWKDRPPVIIDESDATLDSLPRAIECGYRGTSFKNCKGVFKGIANACLIRFMNEKREGVASIISAEDLSNVPPVALQQDLASLSALGISNPERNGHHYFRGMAAFPESVQKAVLDAHGDLFCRHERGFVALRIRDGCVSTDSVVEAPYGRACEFDPGCFTPVDEWRFASLNSS